MNSRIRRTARPPVAGRSPGAPGLLARLRSGSPVDLDGADLPADLLLEALTGRTDGGRAHERGVRVVDARITGEMDWDGQRLPVRLQLEDCAIDRRVQLDHTRVSGLGLVRCRLPGLSAEQLNSSESVRIVDCEIAGSVLLRDAQVSGTLLMNGTAVGTAMDDDPAAAGHDAIRATRLKVSGSVYLADGFTAGRAVRLSGARIGGSLLCRGGRFTGDGDALDVLDAHVDGNVMLNGVKVTGRVIANRVRVGGELEFDGGSFEASGREAVALNGADVGGGVSMRAGFSVHGTVSLAGARIGTNWNCAGGRFAAGASGVVIRAGGAVVNGNVYLGDGLQAAGALRLNGATVGGNLFLAGARIVRPGGRALQALHLTVAGDLVAGPGAAAGPLIATGRVALVGARIGGGLEFEGARLTNPGGVALDLTDAEVGRSVLVRTGFRAVGRVVMERARISGDLDCRGGGFAGVIELGDARVEGSLRWREIVGRPELIDVRGARAEELDDDLASWPAGAPRLSGFVYERLTERAPRDPRLRVEWIRRQPGYTPDPYQQLAGVYRSNGQVAEATVVAMAQQDDLVARGELTGPARAWRWFLGRSIGHGYRPGRAVFILAGLYAITLVPVWLGGRADAFIQVGETAPQPSVTSSRCGDAYPCFSAPAYALENITPILNLHQGEHWVPKSSDPAEWMLRDWLYLTTVAGYAGTTLLAAGLTGLARTA